MSNGNRQMENQKTKKEPKTCNRVSFTYFLEDEERVPEYVLAEHPDVVRAVYQFERSKDGKLHVQGFFRLQEGVVWALKRVKKFCSGGFNDLRAHVETSEGTDGDNWVYCTKEESRCEGSEPIFYGDWEGHKEPGTKHGQQGKRNDLHAVVDALKSGRHMFDVARDHLQTVLKYPGFWKVATIVQGTPCRLKWKSDNRNYDPERTVADFRWYSGSAGSGKTESVWDEFGDSAVYTKNPRNKWFDGYDPAKHKCVLVDDYRPPNRDSPHDFSADFILRLCDVYPFSAEIKGGTLCIRPPVVIFTSNHPLVESFDRAILPPIARRFVERLFISDGDGAPNRLVVEPSVNTTSNTTTVPSVTPAVTLGSTGFPRDSRGATDNQPPAKKPRLDTSFAGRASYVAGVGIRRPPVVDLTQSDEEQRTPPADYTHSDEGEHTQDDESTEFPDQDEHDLTQSYPEDADPEPEPLSNYVDDDDDEPPIGVPTQYVVQEPSDDD